MCCGVIETCVIDWYIEWRQRAEIFFVILGNPLHKKLKLFQSSVTLAYNVCYKSKSFPGWCSKKFKSSLKIAHEDTEKLRAPPRERKKFNNFFSDCIIKTAKRRDEKSQFLKVIKNVVDESSKGLFRGDSMKVLKVHIVKSTQSIPVIIINSKTHIHTRS